MNVTGKAVTVLSDDLSTEMELRDVDYGYRATIEVAFDHRYYSRRLGALLNEEMTRALQAMRRHAEACRLQAKKGKRT